MRNNETNKVLFVSLGCDKNLVDSEEMLGALQQRGFVFTDDEEEADAAIVNTCCFIMDAQKESIDQILALAQRRTEGQLKALIVTGCMAQRYKDEVLREIPEVDAVIGTTAQDRIAPTLEEIIGTAKEAGRDGRLFVADQNLRTGTTAERIVTTGGYYSYLKIAEGCDKKCTYCAIPGIRGSYRSVPMEALIKEANQLASDGVKELVVVAQETTVYGLDIYGEKRLHILLRELCKIDGIEWIRILYCYPEEIYDQLIETISSEKKICHYLDIPIQHSDDTILQRMGRRTNNEYLRNLIGKLRKAVPDIVLRTTLITGFPGETEENFENLKSFVKEMRFDRLGAFAYSAEEGTVAAGMDGQIPDDIKEHRRDEIMLIQQEIAFEKADEKVGMTVPVIIEGRLDDGALVGRTYMDAPDVDGYVFIDSDKDLMSGTIMNVRITGSNEYDLIGEVLSVEEEIL